MSGVRTTHPDYDAYSPKWKRARDVVAGQDAIHKAKAAYLPKLKDEEDEDYKSRVCRSDFFNGTWRTIDALSGMVFRKPPTFDVPAAIEPYLEDVTLSGLTMEGLAKETAEEMLSVGRVGVLIDHPPQPENVKPLTVDAAQKLGMRPTLQIYTTESIRNWKFARVNNAWVLSMVVLGEKHAEPKDEFTDEIEDRYRVLDLHEGVYRQRVFKVEKEKDILLSETVPLMNGKPLSYIPFKIVDVNGKSDCVDEPPLIDLIDANLALYQMNSTYRHTLYFCPPTFYISGYTLDKGEKISIGGTAAMVFPEPQAKAAYAEPQGTMLPELRNAMLDKKQEMALLGARMIADETKQAETLGATQIKRQGENSVLSKIVQSVSESLEWALTVFSEWAGQKAKITYQLNRDFLPAGIDSQTMQALLAAVLAGKLSDEEYFDLMQRGDVIDGDKTFEAHQEQIKAQGPTAIPAPAKPGANPNDAKAA